MRVFVIGLFFLLGACSANQIGTQKKPADLPATLAERASGNAYIPLRGMPVRQLPANSCFDWKDGKKVPNSQYKNAVSRDIRMALPNMVTRFVVANTSVNGGISFGPVGVTAENSSYEAIMDYVNADTTSEVLWVGANVRRDEGTVTIAPSQIEPGDKILGYRVEQFHDSDDVAANSTAKPQSFEGEDIAFTVIVGVGVRITAYINSIKGGVALNGFAGIGAKADGASLVGTLTMESLGITSKAVATALPIPSELDQTTIANSFTATGSIRAQIYDPETKVNVRAVGFESPIGASVSLVNAVTSELSRNRPQWHRPCDRKSASGGNVAPAADREVPTDE